MLQHVSATAVLIVLSILKIDATDFNAFGQDCVDICLMDAMTASTTPAETQRLEEIVKLINRAKEIRIKLGINATVVGIDTTVRSEKALEYDHGGVFTLELNIAALLAFSMPAWLNNPFFINQFDGEQSWYCDNWSCRTRCQIAETILYELEDVLESHNPGLIEDSCRLARNALKHDYCALTNQWKNPLYISIVNSKLNDKYSRRQQYSHSYCKRFKNRLIIGTDAADSEQIKKLASTSDNSFYFDNTVEFKKTMSNLIECMQIECCGGVATPPNRGPSCVRTDGDKIKEFKLK